MDDDETPLTEGEDCVSPTQNTDSAYELGVKGCACDKEQDGQGVCIDGAALICEGEQWLAVEDGPCALELPCDGRLAEVEDCLHYFDTCIKMDNELFCGSGRRTDECAGEIVEGPGGCLVDDAYCTELDSGKYCTGTAAPSCPDNYIPAPDGCPDVQVFWCFQYSESLACQLQELSIKECQAAGGEPVYDPGDGSVGSTGCPEDRQELGLLVPGGIEGAQCCRPEQ